MLRWHLALGWNRLNMVPQSPAMRADRLRTCAGGGASEADPRGRERQGSNGGCGTGTTTAFSCPCRLWRLLDDRRSHHQCLTCA